MELELTTDERIQHILKEGDSLARFFTVEAKRQRRSEAAVFMAVAQLAIHFAKSNSELWQDAVTAHSQAEPAKVEAE